MSASMHLVMDCSETPFMALEKAGIVSAADGADAGSVVVLDGEIEVGGMPDGTQAGRPTVFFVFTLPDGRVVMAETTMALFVTAAYAFKSAYEKELE